MNFKLFTMADLAELSENDDLLDDFSEFFSFADSSNSQVDNNELLEGLHKLSRINKNEIVSRTDRFTLEDLCYSEYYHLHSLIKRLGLQNDAGAKQQLFQTLENMTEIEIDWDTIREIDECFGYTD